MAFRSTITHLVDTKGNIEERQLIGRWRNELESFLQAFEEGMRKGHQGLEIGLEAGLVLKLVVKRDRLPPLLGLKRIIDTLPDQQAAIARETLALGLDCHVGIRLQADRCHRELYVYDTGGAISRLLRKAKALPPLPSNMYVTAYGVDESQGLSAYFTSKKNPRVQAHLDRMVGLLNQELRMDVSPWANDIWQHLRVEGRQWAPAKFGLELTDVPMEPATRIISHYRPPHFRYLVPYQRYSSVVLAGAPGEGVKAWYFTRGRKSDLTKAATTAGTGDPIDDAPSANPGASGG